MTTINLTLRITAEENGIAILEDEYVSTCSRERIDSVILNDIISNLSTYLSVSAYDRATEERKKADERRENIEH